MRQMATNLREMGYITDISIDETSLIMFLKYRENKSETHYRGEGLLLLETQNKDNFILGVFVQKGGNQFVQSSVKGRERGN